MLQITVYKYKGERITELKANGSRVKAKRKNNNYFGRVAAIYYVNKRVNNSDVTCSLNITRANSINCPVP